MENATGSFWDHLDALRSAIIKIAAASVLFGVLAFCFKETLFQIVLAPKNPDFITYRILDRIAGLAGGSAGDFNIELINTGLARQFVVHMKTALCAGAICASPYILYQIFRFVSPALYSNERKYAVKVVGWSYLMFFAGMCASYHWYTVVFSGFNPQSYMMIWYALTLLSPLFALLCWYGKGPRLPSVVLSGLILGGMVMVCCSVGQWYFSFRRGLDALFLCLSVLILYTRPKQTLLALAIGVALSFLSPFVF